VTAAAHRLQEVGNDVQFVVTSRQAPMRTRPGFPETDFSYCELGALSQSQIDEYARLWSAAKDLSVREASELLQVLSTKLSESHIRDLARNPMQLSITPEPSSHARCLVA